MSGTNDSVEARLNATNQALQPHAGGVIESWSDATEGEIRDDQGISLHNPDTDVFMKYTLAGAYDSNIALLLTVGNSRLETYQQMAEIIRQTRMRGTDLATNLEFHYGLVNWFIAQNVNARPTTRFIVPYLTAVGELKQCANDMDLEFAYGAVSKAVLAGAEGAAAAALAEALQLKETLLLRPLQHLLREPHVLSGWLSINRDCYTVIDGKISWNENPLELLADTYHFLNMDDENDLEDAAATIIWDHDNRILQDAMAFYDELNNRVPAGDWVELCSILDPPPHPWAWMTQPGRGCAAPTWVFRQAPISSRFLPSIAEATRFYDLRVNPDLTIHIPAAPQRSRTAEGDGQGAGAPAGRQVG